MPKFDTLQWLTVTAKIELLLNMVWCFVVYSVQLPVCWIFCLPWLFQSFCLSQFIPVINFQYWSFKSWVSVLVLDIKVLVLVLVLVLLSLGLGLGLESAESWSWSWSWISKSWIQVWDYLIFMWISRTSGLKWGFEGQNGKGVVQCWPLMSLFLLLGFLRLCQFWRRLIKKFNHESAHAWIHRYTDRHTDRCKLV